MKKVNTKVVVVSPKKASRALFTQIELCDSMYRKWETKPLTPNEEDKKEGDSAVWKS